MTRKGLDPTLGPQSGTSSIAPALATLEGAVAGMIDNSQIGRLSFAVIGGVAAVVRWRSGRSHRGCCGDGALPESRHELGRDSEKRQ